MSETQAEIIHIPDLAKIMNRTESSIRSAISTGADWVPPSFRMGKRICWRRESVHAFLQGKERSAQEKKSGKVNQGVPGRKRQEPPTLKSVMATPLA